MKRKWSRENEDMKQHRNTSGMQFFVCVFLCVHFVTNWTGVSVFASALSSFFFFFPAALIAANTGLRHVGYVQYITDEYRVYVVKDVPLVKKKKKKIWTSKYVSIF